MKSEKHSYTLFAALLSCSLGLATSSHAKTSKVVKVTNTSDSGPGSFREAVAAANADSAVNRIIFSNNLGTITLESAVSYGGDQGLVVDGSGAVVDSTGGAFALLVADGGGDLELRKITFQNSGAEGVVVDLPDDSEGTLMVTLSDVILAGNALEGLLINDCDGFDLDTCSGSDAGIDLHLASSTVTSNGRGEGVTDIDGIRINERGEGDVDVSFLNSSIDLNGGDGIEVEEGDDGDVNVWATNTTFDDNGDQDPDDFEDGIDVDERGAGSVIATFNNVSAAGNFDEGIDLNEDDDGDILLTILQSDVTDSGDGDGLRCRETGNGDIIVDAKQCLIAGSDDEGIQFSEEDDGDVIVDMKNVEVSGNGDRGIQIEEEGAGSLSMNLLGLIVDNNNYDDGIVIDEKDDGDFDVWIKNSQITNNAEFGIKAEQDDAGVGSMRLQNVYFDSNEDGETDLSGIVLY
jgi:hypothetical protein